MPPNSSSSGFIQLMEEIVGTKDTVVKLLAIFGCIMKCPQDPQAEILGKGAHSLQA